MKLKPVSPEKLIKVLEKLGYKSARQKGSHLIMENSETKKITVIPMHKRDIGKGLLRQIIKEIGIEREEFLKLLYES